MWLANSTILSNWKDCGQNSLLWIHGKRERYLAIVLWQKLILFSFFSRRWEERDLVRKPFNILAPRTYLGGQFYYHRRR
jgi:hypothetical protein